MYKFAFTYLVKQDKKTWNDFECSLKLLNKHILKKLKYWKSDLLRVSQIKK